MLFAASISVRAEHNQLCCLEKVAMRVTIYYKTGDDKVSEDFILDLTEFQRLANDFVNFLNTGVPERGIYSYYADMDHRKVKTLNLNFHEISLIG